MSTVKGHHIAPQSGGFEPQRAFNFYLEIYGISGTEQISMAMDQTFFPSSQNQPITLNYHAETRKVAGQMTLADGQFSVIDYLDESQLSSLLQWRKLVMDAETGALGFASAYKKQAAVILVAPDGSRPRLMKIEGIWPVQVDVPSLSMTDNNASKIQVTVAYDRALPQF